MVSIFEKLFDEGYAFPGATISSDKRHWKHKNEVITLPSGAVQEFLHPEENFPIAKWEDVKSEFARG